MKARPHSVGNGNPIVVDIEVSYRPKGRISYLGTTKYDGWTVIVLNRSRDGILLDRNDQPLKDGDQPIELPNEVFQDLEFNELDFGVFVDEIEVQDVRRATLDAVVDEITSRGPWNGLGYSGFIAPLRSRPFKKIILSSAPTASGVDGFGTHICNFNTSTPHLEHVLMEHIVKLMFEFIEGKASIKNFGTKDLAFVEADSLVECQPNEHGFGSWRDTLHWYTPLGFLEDLAKRLMAVYALEVAVIDGTSGGLVLRCDGKTI